MRSTFHLLRHTLVFSLLFASLAVWAFSPPDTVVVDMAAADRCIREQVKIHGADRVLVVLDIDNTLLTSATDLGGDIWYQWQRGELDLKPTEDQKIKECFYEDAIGLLYELGTMTLTDERIPGYIREWQAGGLTVFALTSRSPLYRTPTEQELLKQGIDFRPSALRSIEGNRLVLTYDLERPLSYANGILMTTGMNKGDMLHHILGRAGRSFPSIVFVDDSEKNVRNMVSAWEGTPGCDLHVFHYEKVVRDRMERNGGRVLTPAEAETMARDWALLQKPSGVSSPAGTWKGNV
ncbi:MAG: DUF2608 domain-containing protein [Bacteroidales bacterium]